MSCSSACANCPQPGNDDNKNDIKSCCVGDVLLRPPPLLDVACFVFATLEQQYRVRLQTLFSLRCFVTEVVFPSQVQPYEVLRQIYNKRFIVYPAAIVLAHTESDVVQAIRFAREHGLPVSPRSGAHCYEPWNMQQYGIVVDQRPRQQGRVCSKQNTATLEPGMLLGRTILLLQEGTTIPAGTAALLPGNKKKKKRRDKDRTRLPSQACSFGTCPANGVAGLSLGGGIGFLNRKLGLTLDNIESMRVALSDGRVVTASSAEHADLFFGMRGAGGNNFGIMTELTLRTITQHWVTIFAIEWPFEGHAASVIAAWQQWAPFVSNNDLTTECNVHNRFQPVVVTGQFTTHRGAKGPMTAEACAQEQAELLQLLEPMLRLPGRTNLMMRCVSVSDAARFFGIGNVRPPFFKNVSAFVFSPLSPAAIQTIVENMALLGEDDAFHKVEMNALQGAVSEVPKHATAFAARDALFWMQITSLWSLQEQAPFQIERIQRFYDAMKPFLQHEGHLWAYANAADAGLGVGSDRRTALVAYYGDNVDALIRVKQTYDPINLFQFPQSIPLI